jgi:hypothetical protein
MIDRLWRSLIATKDMALGLSPNLKLDELPSSFSATGNEFDQNHIHRIKAFWSLFLIERYVFEGIE